ncbi:MAG: DUF655 domain-containing protein [Candidatus Diapherotrites archaeon]|nr:DUF655 domain-containing protein [Candidatus Diapherotrites archaeon]
MANEENAYVLDYLAKGKSSDYRESPLAQVLGTSFFTLLEVVPKAELKAMQKVYIGKEKREEVSLIKRRIAYKELTSNATAELQNAIEKIVEENKDTFLQFYNISHSISLRMHQIELLPGFGKKHVLDLLDEREKKEFQSFEEIQERVKGIPDPLKAIVKRIVQELESEEDLKYYLFTRRPPTEEEGKDRGQGFRRDTHRSYEQ